MNHKKTIQKAILDGRASNDTFKPTIDKRSQHINNQKVLREEREKRKRPESLSKIYTIDIDTRGTSKDRINPMNTV